MNTHLKPIPIGRLGDCKIQQRHQTQQLARLTHGEFTGIRTPSFQSRHPGHSKVPSGRSPEAGKAVTFPLCHPERSEAQPNTVEGTHASVRRHQLQEFSTASSKVFITTSLRPSPPNQKQVRIRARLQARRTAPQIMSPLGAAYKTEISQPISRAKASPPGTFNPCHPERSEAPAERSRRTPSNPRCHRPVREFPPRSSPTGRARVRQCTTSVNPTPAPRPPSGSAQ